MTIEEMDSRAALIVPRPERVHTGSRVWAGWLASLTRRRIDGVGLGFPEVISPGGVRVILDSAVPDGQIEFQSGPLT